MCGHYNIPDFYFKIKQVIRNEQDNAYWRGHVGDRSGLRAALTAAGKKAPEPCDGRSEQAGKKRLRRGCFSHRLGFYGGFYGLGRALFRDSLKDEVKADKAHYTNGLAVNHGRPEFPPARRIFGSLL